jgi:hypothetical protein
MSAALIHACPSDSKYARQLRVVRVHGYDISDDERSVCRDPREHELIGLAVAVGDERLRVNAGRAGQGGVDLDQALASLERRVAALVAACAAMPAQVEPPHQDPLGRMCEAKRRRLNLLPAR